jgi:zinc D-Ala-D-Ala carboxypeptidase
MDTTLLSPHFSQRELGVIGCEQRIIDNAIFICMNLMEPIRAHFNSPINVHDGYRDIGHNTRVGGKPTSFHLFDGGKSAADFDITGHGFKEVFDWIRLTSKLAFDKVILETNLAGHPANIHLQVDRNNAPRRQAFIGGTGNSAHYTQVEVR